jgi:hypothetical protein
MWEKNEIELQLLSTLRHLEISTLAEQTSPIGL